MEGLGREFCLVCGADPPLYGERMCEPCVRKRVKLVQVPENIPWVRCARCGIVEIQGKWVHISEDEIWDELIQRHVEFHKDAEDINLALQPQTVSDRHTLLHLQVEGVIEDLLFQEQHTMRARMEWSLPYLHSSYRKLLRSDRSTAFDRKTAFRRGIYGAS